MDTTALFAIGKIALALCFMITAICRGVTLWLALFLGGTLLALLFGIMPPAFIGIIGGMVVDPSFITIFFAVTCILILSEIQGHSGQGQRLALGLTPYMRSPRARLVFFPALMGILPMPGGAIFSCPLVREVARGYTLTNRQLVLINYWFRHIWESACPLYPGYILACALGNIPPSQLWRYALPFVIISFLTGWFFLFRDPIEKDLAHPAPAVEKRPLPSVLLDALPMVVAVAAAPLYSALFAFFGETLPNGASFIFSFLTASAIAIVQTKTSVLTVAKLMVGRSVIRMLLLMVMIFLFKEIVIAANVVDALARIITHPSAILVLFLLLPVIIGSLTGMMMGFVGTCFPLLIALLEQTGNYEERLCWILLALAAGHFGQMVSPMHSCFLVTIEYFRTPLAKVWGETITMSSVQIVLTISYVAALYLTVNPLF